MNMPMPPMPPMMGGTYGPAGTRASEMNSPMMDRQMMPGFRGAPAWLFQGLMKSPFGAYAQKSLFGQAPNTAQAMNGVPAWAMPMGQ